MRQGEPRHVPARNVVVGSIDSLPSVLRLAQVIGRKLGYGAMRQSSNLAVALLRQSLSTSSGLAVSAT
jgi:hypothetical protein